MAEYINREALLDFPIRANKCDKEHANEHFINGIESVLEYAENLPTADVAPVVHGRWIYEEETLLTLSGYRCSVCMRPRWLSPDVPEAFKYCPNCGSKMDGGNGDAAD